MSGEERERGNKRSEKRRGGRGRGDRRFTRDRKEIEEINL